jgi:Zn-dependent protease with chaperone function
VYAPAQAVWVYGDGEAVTTVRLVGALAAAGAATGTLALGGVYLVWVLGGCYIASVPLPDAPVCASSLWPTPWMPFALLAVSLLAIAATAVTTIRAALGQFGGARRQRRVLEERRIATPDRLARVAAPAGLSDRVRCVAMKEPIACTIGLTRPRVYVSTGLLAALGDDELAAVLAHEAEHARCRDPLALGAVRVAHRLAVIWPLARRLADRTWLDLEARADARAIDAVGRTPFLAALYKVLSTDADRRTESVAVGSIDGLLADRLAILAGQFSPRPRDPAAVRRTVISAVVVMTSLMMIILATLRASGGPS